MVNEEFDIQKGNIEEIIENLFVLLKLGDVYRSLSISEHHYLIS